jgi:cytochrome P450
MTQTDPAPAAAEAKGCPVHNFNYTVKQPAETWFHKNDELREESPIYWNDFSTGYWALTRNEDILGVLQDSETFSNASVSVLSPNPGYRWIPMHLDGDEHMQWRRQLGPLFSPKAVERMEGKVRQRAADLIDEILAKGTGEADYMAEFSQLYPTSIFIELMGLPIEELPKFMEWEHGILHSSETDIERREAERVSSMKKVTDYFQTIIADRRANPQDDIVSRALSFEIDGKPVSDDDLLMFCLLMFMAGLDTVSVTLGWSLYYLATHPEDRQRIVDDPDMIPDAIEEFLRVYAIVQTGRKVAKDTEILGCPVKAGQMVALPLNSAMRDEKAFPNGTEVDITRSPNNHFAFSAGQHRCLGSHLARRELKIALEEWHKRIPDYRLAPDAELVETGGQLGLTALPLQWDQS